MAYRIATTDTVWDKIKPTQALNIGSSIPKSFELTVGNSKYWVNPNATKHMVEYANRTLSHGKSLTEQQYGKWIMRAEDIQGLTPAQIMDKYALPNLPTHICDVTIPANTTVRTGIVNKVEAWGNGGGIQFELLSKLDDKFFNNGRFFK